MEYRRPILNHTYDRPHYCKMLSLDMAEHVDNKDRLSRTRPGPYRRLQDNYKRSEAILHRAFFFNDKERLLFLLSSRCIGGASRYILVHATSTIMRNSTHCQDSQYISNTNTTHNVLGYRYTANGCQYTRTNYTCTCSP